MYTIYVPICEIEKGIHEYIYAYTCENLQASQEIIENSHSWVMGLGWDTHFLLCSLLFHLIFYFMSGFFFHTFLRNPGWYYSILPSPAFLPIFSLNKTCSPGKTDQDLFVCLFLLCIFCQWSLSPNCLLKKILKSLKEWPSNPTTGHIPWENHNSKRDMYHNVHCSTIYNNQDMEET